MVDPKQTPMLEETMKTQACSTANEILRIANALPTDDNNYRVQVFLVALAITLAKFIDSVATSESAHSQILKGYNANVRQVLNILKSSKEAERKLQ